MTDRKTLRLMALTVNSIDYFNRIEDLQRLLQIASERGDLVDTSFLMSCYLVLIQPELQGLEDSLQQLRQRLREEL